MYRLYGYNKYNQKSWIGQEGSEFGITTDRNKASKWGSVDQACAVQDILSVQHGITVYVESIPDKVRVWQNPALSKAKEFFGC